MFSELMTLGYPTQILQAFAGPAAAMARPLVGLGALATFFVMFRPLVMGVFQAIRFTFSPRLTLEERNSRRTLQGVLMLNRMARDIEQFEPNQAAELRQLAGRI